MRSTVSGKSRMLNEETFSSMNKLNKSRHISHHSRAKHRRSTSFTSLNCFSVFIDPWKKPEKGYYTVLPEQSTGTTLFITLSY